MFGWVNKLNLLKNSMDSSILYNFESDPDLECYILVDGDVHVEIEREMNRFGR